jgi:hypothetical protein
MATHNYDAVLVTDTPTFPSWTRGYGAHRIATHLRERGYSVLVVDFSMAMSIQTWKEICSLAIGDTTRFVGFSTTWWPYRDRENLTKNFNPAVSLRDNVSDGYIDTTVQRVANEAATFTEDIAVGLGQRWVDVVKEVNPKCKILIGGAKLDWYPDFPADYKLSGIAETEILDYLEQPKRIWPTMINHDTNGTAYDWGWTTSFTRYTDFDQIRSDEVLTLETSRGCRFKCLYCAFPLIGQKNIASYLKTEEAIYTELLENYERFGVTDYWIADDTFNDTTEKLVHVLNAIRRLPFKPRFRCYLRLDVLTMNPEQIEMLLEIGMVSCFFGIESFHPQAAKLIGKGMSTEKRKETLYKIQEAWGDKVSVNAGYIIGLPYESYEHAKEQMEWFLQEDCPVHMVYCFPLMINPEGTYPNHPMSELDRTYEKYGYSIPDLKKHNFWFKEDDTGIPSFARAFEIIVEFNDKFEKKNVPVKEKIQYGMGNSMKDPRNEYFPSLIQMLKDRLK